MPEFKLPEKKAPEVEIVEDDTKPEETKDSELKNGVSSMSKPSDGTEKAESGSKVGKGL